MRQKLGIKVKIDETYKLGHKTCHVKLENRNEKDSILPNKRKLKSVKRETYIVDDLTKEEMKVKQELRKIAKIEKEKEKQPRQDTIKYFNCMEVE